MQMRSLSAFFLTLILFDVDEDDVVPDLDNAPPRDHVLEIAAKKPAQPSGTGNDDGEHAAGAAVDLEICDTAQRAAGTDIDDLLLTKVTQADRLWLFTATAVRRSKLFRQGTGSFLAGKNNKQCNEKGIKRQLQAEMEWKDLWLALFCLPIVMICKEWESVQ